MTAKKEREEKIFFAYHRDEGEEESLECIKKYFLRQIKRDDNIFGEEERKSV